MSAVSNLSLAVDGSGGLSDLREHHQAKISQRNDGSWILTCPECLRAPEDELPIGIGIPLDSRLTAERLRKNHMGHPIRNR